MVPLSLLSVIQGQPWSQIQPWTWISGALALQQPGSGQGRPAALLLEVSPRPRPPCRFPAQPHWPWSPHTSRIWGTPRALSAGRRAHTVSAFPRTWSRVLTTIGRTVGVTSRSCDSPLDHQQKKEGVFSASNKRINQKDKESPQEGKKKEEKKMDRKENQQEKNRETFLLLEEVLQQFCLPFPVAEEFSWNLSLWVCLALVPCLFFSLGLEHLGLPSTFALAGRMWQSLMKEDCWWMCVRMMGVTGIERGGRGSQMATKKDGVTARQENFFEEGNKSTQKGNSCNF